MNMFHNGNNHYLYDGSLIDDASVVSLFEHEDILLSARGLARNTAKGRGDAIFFRYKNLSLVYKHYQRGGLIARLSHDQYFGMGLEKSRAFRECRLLHKLQSYHLPSPEPVAARVIRLGLLYRADLVMKEIENAETLADLCSGSAVTAETWFDIGQCISRFHEKDVYHADLNARNILVGEEGKVYLLDFDKGCIRDSHDSWKTSNLARLNRSLKKFQNSEKNFQFTQSDWDQLLSGYNKRL